MDNTEEKVGGRVFKFDFNRIKVDEYEQFEADLNSLKKDRAIPWYGRVLVEWPFEGDPADPASFGALGLADFAEVQKEFWESFRGLFDPVAKAAGVVNRGRTGK